MLHISPAATIALHDNLANASVPPESGYRLAPSDNGYRFHLDRPTENDRVVRKEGRVVLMVAQPLNEALEGIALNLKDGDDRRLVLEPAAATNPETA